jgi:hypothetical protein
VEVVWPRECSGRAQIHPDWTISCGTKMDLIQEIESWVRMNSARCERHLIKLGYRCPEGQHGLCTARPRIAGGGGCAGQRAGNGNGQRERGRLRHRATLPKRAPRAPAAVWRWKLTQVQSCRIQPFSCCKACVHCPSAFAITGMTEAT